MVAEPLVQVVELSFVGVVSAKLEDAILGCGGAGLGLDFVRALI